MQVKILAPQVKILAHKKEREGNMFPSLEFFSEKEFLCKCCGKVEMNHFFLMNLVRARRMAQTRFIINSGFRCQKHNQEIGGSPGSSHMKGCAADIACDNDEKRQKIISSLIISGFNRIGIAQNFIHVDSDKSKNDRIWLYPMSNKKQGEEYDVS